MVGDQSVVGITQYYMIIRYDLKVYDDQLALPDKQQTLMDDSVDAIYGDIVLKLNHFLVD